MFTTFQVESTSKKLLHFKQNMSTVRKRGKKTFRGVGSWKNRKEISKTYLERALMKNNI